MTDAPYALDNLLADGDANCAVVGDLRLAADQRLAGDGPLQSFARRARRPSPARPPGWRPTSRSVGS